MQTIERHQSELLLSPLFSWLSPRGLQTLTTCFELEVEELVCGDTRRTEHRIGYLLRGDATLSGREGDTAVKPLALFGISLTEGQGRRPVDAALTARQDCVVVWMNYDVVQNVCYRACWFHARLIREIDDQLSSSDEA